MGVFFLVSTNKVKTGKIYNVLDPKLNDFESALQRLLMNLAKQIVSDGEGAKKFITIKINCFCYIKIII